MRSIVLLLLSVGFMPFASAADSPAAAKLFAVHFTTGPAWDKSKPANEQKFFTEHSANLARLRAAGVLVLGARYGDKGLIVVRAASTSAVLGHLAPDLSVEAGVFTAAIDEFNPFYHGSTTPPLATPEAITLRAYLDAFNRRDPDAVAALLAPNVKWLTVGVDQMSVANDGREAVRTWLSGHFKSQPDTRSEFLSLEQTGPLLAVRERLTGTVSGTRHSQQSHAVYEVREGLITQVWHFPATRASTP